MTANEVLKGLGKIDVKRPIKPELLEGVEENWNSLQPSVGEALDEVLEGKADQAADSIAFIGIHYAAQMGCTEIFPKLIELARKDEKSLDRFLGDALTEEFPDILYFTFNGDLQLLLDLLYDEDAYEFSRSDAMSVLSQLQMDGIYPEEEWKKTLKDLAESVDPQKDSSFYAEIIGMMAECHYLEFKDLIREKIQSVNMDISIYGGYAEHVDLLFGDRKEREEIHKPFDAARQIRRWYKLSGEKTYSSPKKGMHELMDKAFREAVMDAPRTAKMKVGRNDPCPCGSGKKYKNCCMRKDEEALKMRDEIEPYERKMRYLGYYPKLSFDPVTGQKRGPVERTPGCFYLEDYYDEETIRTDVLIYLGLRRIGLLDRAMNKVPDPDGRERAYLLKAFARFRDQYRREGDTSLAEYDRKHMIHYASGDWIPELLSVLEDPDTEEEITQFLKTETTDGHTERTLVRPVW